MNLRFLPIIVLAALSLMTSRAHAQAVLRDGDVFEIVLSGMPVECANEFHLQYTVGDDGEVSIPLIGQIKAAGLSTTQFARNVERKLVSEKIFTRPTVVITPQAQSRFVTVGGGVRQSGAVPWSTDLTLSAALKRAGGASDFGNISKTRLTREGKTAVYNLKRAAKGDQTQNPKLLPGDEVEVPE